MLAVTGSLPLKALPALPVCACAPTFAAFPSLHPLDCSCPIRKSNTLPVTQYSTVCIIFTFPPCAAQTQTLVSSLPSTPPAFPFISLWDYRHATPTEPSLWEWIHKDFLPRWPVCNTITVGPANAIFHSPRVHKREREKKIAELLHKLFFFYSLSFLSFYCAALFKSQTYLWRQVNRVLDQNVSWEGLKEDFQKQTQKIATKKVK